jgi:ABC-2 type transport system ATP-binding protein
MDSLSETYVQLLTSGDRAAAAKKLGPIAESELFGKSVLLFEGGDRESLRALGELHTPSVADLFVAKVREARA